MTDFLIRLARRQLDPMPGLRPRLPSRFDPPGAGIDTAITTELNTEVNSEMNSEVNSVPTGRAARPDAPQRPPTLDRSQSRRGTVSTDAPSGPGLPAPGHRDFGAAALLGGTAVREGSAHGTIAPALAPLAFAPPALAPPAAARRLGPVQGGRPPTLRPWPSGPFVTSTASPVHVGTAPHDRPDYTGSSAPGPLVPGPVDPGSLDPGPVDPGPFGAGLLVPGHDAGTLRDSGQQAAPADNRTRAPADDVAVTVTIGRVEITAVLPETAHQPPRSSIENRRALSLEDYLEQRNGAQRP